MADFFRGVDVVKLPRGGFLAGPRPIKLRVVADALVWSSKKKKTWEKVPMDQVKRVMEGQQTKTFQKFKRTHSEDKTKSLSIVFMDGNEESTLDVIVNDEEHYKALVDHLNVEVEKAAKRYRDPEARYMAHMWTKADTNADNSLTKNEVFRLASQINLNVDKRYLNKVFDAVDKDQSQELNFEEFMDLMHRLRKRPDLIVLWDALTNNKSNTVGCPAELSFADTESEALHESTLKLLPLADFHNFLTTIQKEELTLENAKALLLQNDPEHRGESISYSRFMAYMNSEVNQVMDPAKRKEYQDMTQPMNHYYIASSHNTYLEGDQLNSASSVNRYISDLMNSCRCVELDCWDGADGEPIVYHGHTLTGRILFKDIIQAVNEYAFKTSPYPVVLSLENHCHMEQQEKMAAYLKQYLGNKLAMPVVFTEGVTQVLPSPKELMGKILVKGKRLPKSAAPEPGKKEVDEEVEESDDEEEEDGPGISPRYKKQDSAPKSPPSSATSSRSLSPKEKKKEKKPKIAQALSAITWMPGVHFKGWDAPHDPANCTSYLENKMDSYVTKHPVEWGQLNKRMFTRIYPAGVRIDSSNYNPMAAWTVGCQLVALNYQTPGLPMQINRGRFLENGNTGYILKPLALRDPTLTFHPIQGPFPSSIELTITVLSGQQLPKPYGAQTGEIVDPYVLIEVVGVPEDCKKVQTPHISDNGFNPTWSGQSFTFQVRSPEHALVNFAVWDRDNGVDDDYIANVVFPVSTLRTGYRTVPLNSFSGSRGADFEHSSIFVHISPKPAGPYSWST